MSGRQSSTTSAGFTLIEAAVSTVIVAVMAAAAISLLAGTAGARNSQAQWRRADLLAADLMSEIVQRRYSEPSGSALFLEADPGEADGRSRKLFDDTDDYNGLSELPPVDRAGASLPGYDGWQRIAKVELVSTTAVTAVIGIDEGLKRITVTVTSPTGLTRQLTAYRSRWGVFDQRPGAARKSDEISGVELRLKLGTMPDPLITSVPTGNLALP